MPVQLIESLRRFHRETFPRYREHYQRLVKDYPDTREAAEAKARITSM